MYKVKVSIPNQEKRLNIKDFVDNDENIYKDCKFYINEDTEEVDYWFVLENLNNNLLQLKFNTFLCFYSLFFKRMFY